MSYEGCSFNTVPQFPACVVSQRPYEPSKLGSSGSRSPRLAATSAFWSLVTDHWRLSFANRYRKLLESPVSYRKQRTAPASNRYKCALSRLSGSIISNRQSEKLKICVSCLLSVTSKFIIASFSHFSPLHSISFFTGCLSAPVRRNPEGWPCVFTPAARRFTSVAPCLR